MLILSRRAEQQILFPHLGICVNVLQVKGQLVKLGVEAPKSVRVLRSELAETPDPEIRNEPPAPELDHDQRNVLNLLQLRIKAIQMRLERGDTLAAQDVLDSLLEQYSEVDHSLGEFDEQESLRCADRAVRLLVVEDCDNERQLMAYLLASHGFDVQVAPDGRVALEMLATSARLPDFVLMDMQMPNADGLETLLEIRSNEALRHLKVFAVTGVKRDPEKEPIGHGWDGWFRKPIDVPALVNRLRLDLASQAASVGV